MSGTELDAALIKFADGAWPFAVAFAGIGVITATLWQGIKELIPIHRRFNKRQIANWAGRDQTIIAKLEDLCANRNAPALYTLKTKQLVARVKGAAHGALFDGRAHLVLLRFLVSSEGEQHGGSKGRGAVVIDQWLDASDLARDTPTPDNTAEAERLRNAIVQRIQGRLDALEVTLSHEWQWRNRVVSLAISFCFAVWILMRYDSSADYVSFGAPLNADWGAIWRIIWISLLAAFVAPVAKDLVAGLQSIRHRP